MEQTGEKKADLREMQMAALRYDLSTARPLKELVIRDIRSGVDPAWIVVKYGHHGVTLDRVLGVKAAIERQEEAKRRAQGETERGADSGVSVLREERSAETESVCIQGAKGVGA